jgi:ADP-ribose pyrophosphatase YjhB (NUDIX family)
MKSPASLDFPRPLSTVDVVIFAIREATPQVEAALQVLLVRRPDDPREPFPGSWALPGGFLDIARDADLEACALRKLREKTGVAAPYLEQLGSWGSASRDPRGWAATHVYIALLPVKDVTLAAGGNAPEAAWSEIRGQRVREPLAFDHAEILSDAVRRLRSKVEYTSLPAFMLPREFTLSELQRVNEIILDRPLEKKAFRTRVLATDLLQEVDGQRSGANRPAQLYRLRQRKEPVFFARALVARDAD